MSFIRNMITISEVEKEYLKDKTIAFIGIFSFLIIVAMGLYVTEINHWTTFIGLAVLTVFVYVFVLFIELLFIGFRKIFKSFDVGISNITEYMKKHSSKISFSLGFIQSLAGIGFFVYAYLYWPIGTITTQIMGTESTFKFGYLMIVGGIAAIYMAISLFATSYKCYKEDAQDS